MSVGNCRLCFDGTMVIGLVCILPIMDGIELAGWKNSVEFNALVGIVFYVFVNVHVKIAF